VASARTNDRVAYLDSSAFVKTVVLEAESTQLERYLAQTDRLVSSSLLETEARRAALRVDPRHLPLVEQRLHGVSLIAVTTDILVAAGSLRPVGIRSLDAIHLATALELGGELDCVVTYDERMAAAAASLGLRVQTPL
jgi:predicted nucleic acid-binding protein